MGKKDIVWDWWTAEHAEGQLFVLESGSCYRKEERAEARRRIAKWLQVDEDNHPGCIRVGFFPRDYAAYSRLVSDCAKAICAEAESLAARHSDVLAKAERARTKGGKHRAFLEASDLEEKINLLLDAPEGEARTKRIVREHEEIVEAHRKEQAEQKRKRDAALYAKIAEELARDSTVKGTAIARKLGVPAYEVYRLWKPIKPQQPRKKDLA